MKLIVLDYFRRRWLMTTVFCLIFLIIGLVLHFTKEIPYTSIWLFIYLGPNTWSTDLNKGYARIALALPFTARQIGRTFWWLSVGVPASLFALFCGLGVLIASPTKEMFWPWLEITLTSGLFFGATFWIFSGSPTRPSNNWKSNIGKQLYGFGFFGVVVGGGYLLYKSGIGTETKYIIAGAFCLVCSILGWFRAEGLIVDYGEYRYGNNDSSDTKKTYKPQAGYGGILFLITDLSTRWLGVGITIIAAVVGWSVYSNHRLDLPDISRLMPQTQIWFFLLGFGFIAPVFTHLKFLRTLPLTSRQMAATILYLVLMPILIYGGIVAALVSVDSGILPALSLFKIYILCLAPACILTTGAVWHGEKRFERIIPLIIILIISGIPAIFQMTYGIWNSGKTDLSLWFVVGFPLAFFLAALFAISHLLEKNDMTYRMRPEDVNRAM